MPWASVQDFRGSETYKRVTEMHGWATEKLQKFVSAFNEVFQRAKRNGADDAKAESLAYPIAFHVAKRAASADTIAKSSADVHYIAAMAPHQAQRNLSGSEVVGGEYKFSLLRTALPLLKSLVAGVAPNWEHNPEHQIGVIRDIVPRDQAPADIQAKADPAVPFFFVASFRDDIPPESRNEVGVSAEWFPLGAGEALPFNFAKSHNPLNGPELGIMQIAALLSEAEHICPDKHEGCTAATPCGQCNAAQRLTELGDGKLPTPTRPDVTAAASPKGYQAPPGSTTTGAPKMPDPPLEAQVASLQTALESERTARKDAELKFAALKTQADADHALVASMREDALDKAASDAALQLVKDGQIVADAVPRFAARCKKLLASGQKAEWEALVADLPKRTIGAPTPKEPVAIAAAPAETKASILAAVDPRRFGAKPKGA